MDIEYINPQSGKSSKASVNNISQDFIDLMSMFNLTDAQIRNKIDSLNISADAKALLYGLNKFVFTCGNIVIKIGKKIIDFILAMLKNFPHLSFGIIVGIVLGSLIAAIPLIGAALGSLAMSIAVALGVVLGGLEELKSADIRGRVERFINELRPLQA